MRLRGGKSLALPRQQGGNRNAGEIEKLREVGGLGGTRAPPSGRNYWRTPSMTNSSSMVSAAGPKLYVMPQSLRLMVVFPE